jgi:hypothetical protein
MKATILTAIMDHYDPLPAVCPQEGVDVDWVVVTDDPDLTGEGWRVIYEPRGGRTARDAGYPPKIQPWRYTDTPASVWVDASIWVRSPRFAADLLEDAWPLALFPHPDRDCLYDEIRVTATMPRYAGTRFDEQAAAYRAAGHPPHWGLCATVIARRHTAAVVSLGDAWMAEVASWGGSDQLALPVALRGAGIQPHPLPGSLQTNQWFEWRQSARHFQPARVDGASS